MRFDDVFTTNFGTKWCKWSAYSGLTKHMVFSWRRYFVSRLLFLWGLGTLALEALGLDRNSVPGMELGSED